MLLLPPATYEEGTVRLVVRREFAPRGKRADAPLTRQEIESRLRDAERAGVDVAAAQAELKNHAARRQAKKLQHVGVALAQADFVGDGRRFVMAWVVEHDFHRGRFCLR